MYRSRAIRLSGNLVHRNINFNPSNGALKGVWGRPSPTIGGCSVLDIKDVKDAEGGLAPLAEVRCQPPVISRNLVDNALVIGIDIGATNVKIALVDAKARISHKRLFLTEDYPTKNLLLNAVLSTTNEILLAPDVKRDKILGIGIGAPGLVDSAKGIIHYFVNIPDWKEVPLGDIFRKSTGLPTYIDNDVNLMALGEHRFGAGCGFSNLLCITLGSGVGGGIILNGRLYRGTSLSAGEIGHMTINEDGPECNCGNKGCMETYVGNRYLIERYLKKVSECQGIKVSSMVTSETICKLAKEGHRIAIDIWRDVGEHLGTALASAINLLNPEIIVIGGGIANAGRFLFHSLRQAVKKRAMSIPYNAVKIVRARLGEDAGIIGASVLVREHESHE